MLKSIEDVLESAREYCGLIEDTDEYSDVWLMRLLELLPRLHAQISLLSDVRLELDLPCEADLDVRFELFSHLHALLGERDGYWLEFDGMPGGAQAMTGSLADDLTDIYCELKNALRLVDVDLDPVIALQGLSQGYRVHWGQHLVDAERHLYSLQARDQLAV